MVSSKTALWTQFLLSGQGSKSIIKQLAIRKNVSTATIPMFDLLTIFTATIKQAFTYQYGKQSRTMRHLLILIIILFFLIAKETGNQSLSNLPKITQLVNNRLKTSLTIKKGWPSFISLSYLGNTITSKEWKLINSWFQPSTRKFSSDVQKNLLKSKIKTS